MNTKRLLEGAAFLENLHLGPDEQFDMSRWVSPKVWKRGQYGRVEQVTCGTAGCAMGWFAHKGLWGLRADMADRAIIFTHPVTGSKYDGWDVPEIIFNIDWQRAGWLFRSSSYGARRNDVTKEMVAARMRHLAGGGTPETWEEAEAS